MKLTFYGGTGEIGGNKILLEDKNTAIFLDFGKSYHEASKYFEEFLNPRVAHGLKDYLALDLLPQKQSIYREDLIEVLNKEGEKNICCYEKPLVDGILLSHGHLDHVGYVSFLNPQIPVYTTKKTMAVLKAFAISRPKNLENEILELSWRNSEDPKKRKKRKRKFKIVNSQSPFFIKNLEITPLLIDHSLPGASMFLIKTSQGNILYSGDFRLSELKQEEKEKISDFLKKSKIKIFICEGTRVTEQLVLTEEAVYEKALKNVAAVKGLVVVDYSIGDVMRFKTLLKIARQTKRLIALPYNYFNYLSFLNQEGVLKEEGIESKDFQNLVLYAKKKITLRKWEKDLLKNNKICTADEIKENKNRFMLVLNFYQVPELIDIQPDEKSYYLRAITEPHSEEMEISEERFVNWIKHFRMQGLKEDENNHQKQVFERAHISGHISGKELAEFIAAIQPETVIPVHTEFPEEFKKFHKNVKIIKKGDVLEFS
jgi:ribonuclease J